MIPQRELLTLSTEWVLDANVIEKDYVLGWLLAAIGQHPLLVRSWVFKGGTCLRKCYYETYRLSEDIDVTVIDGGPEAPEDLVPIFTEIRSWLHDEAGIGLDVDSRSFQRRQNLRGNPTTRGRVGYRGPHAPRQLPKVKIDITSDEVIVQRPVLRPIRHPYSDSPAADREILCYTLTDLYAEKLRALSQRCRPRDLYDAVHLHRHPDLFGQAHNVASALDRKCRHAGIEVPTIASMPTAPVRDEIEREWSNMLEHQLPRPLPPFTVFWEALDSVFAWLAGEAALPVPPRAERDGLDPDWLPPRAMTSWRRGFPFELIRYAGANRLKVDIDYRATDGRRGSRRVEPYSLRRTRDGHILLFVVNDYGALRAYRVDRVAGARPTEESFLPRFLVEF